MARNTLSRRIFISAAVGSVGTFGSVLSEADTPNEPSDNRIYVLSPKDAFVTTTNVSHGASVSAGDPVCRLDYSDEDKRRDAVKAAQSMIDLEAEAFTDDQVAKRRKMLETSLSSAQATLDFATKKATKIEAMADMGLKTKVESDQVALAKTIADCELQKAQLALDRFDFSITQLKSKKDLIDSQLAIELTSINDDEFFDSVSSPSAGKVSLKVAPGVFVKKGDPIAEIVPEAPQSCEILILSHKDAFINDLHGVSGSVNKGDLLFSLDTRTEDKQIEQLQKTLALLDIQAQTYSDTQIAARRRPLEVAHTQSEASNTFASGVATYYADEGDAIIDEERWRTQAVAAKTACDLQRTELALTSFDFAANQVKKRQTLLRARVAAEVDRLTTLRGRCTVNSPTSGTVTVYVKIYASDGTGTLRQTVSPK
jgi:multidrug resistance efflux pump